MDHGSQPIVSVAMCTFNGDAYLGDQIESILRQTVKVDEIVVSDDVSSDGTRALLKGYREKYPHLFRLYLRDANTGAIDNFAFAAGQCRGDIIFFCDQDDVWTPQKVEASLSHFRDNRCLLVFSDGRLIDAQGADLGLRLWQRFRFSKVRRFLWRRFQSFAALDILNNNNKVTGATVAFRRSLLDQALPVPLLPPGFWHDGWFALQAAAHGGLRFDAECLTDYRIHPKQQVGIKPEAGHSMRPSVAGDEFTVSFANRYPVRAKQIARWRFAQQLREKILPRSRTLDDR